MADEFELLPAEDDLAPTTEEALNAAVASALSDPEALVAAPVEQPDPTGYTWLFDFEAGRFVRQGAAPARVTGLEPLKQRVMMSLNVARFVHPIYSDRVGVSNPNHGIGEAGLEAQLAADDWRVQIREALMALDDVADVAVEVIYDPVAGVLEMRKFVVTTNADIEIPFDDIRLTVED